MENVKDWLEKKGYYNIGLRTDRNHRIDLYLSDVLNEYRTELLRLHDFVNCVYVVTERDQYGEQLFKGVFATREKAIEYLTAQGLKESNTDEINEIELD